jgi:hypothetical protein
LTRAPLHGEIDDAGRRRESVVQRRGALQDFHALFVFERQVDQVHHRQDAVEPVVAAVLDIDAADGDVAVHRGGDLRGTHAGGIAQRVEQALRLLRLDQRLRYHIDGQRGVELARAAETAGLHEVGAVAVRTIGGDDDLFQGRCWRRVGTRAQRRDARDAAQCAPFKDRECHASARS